MDGVSVAASIVGIATAGIHISIKVATLAGQISTASERVSTIGNDVSLTSGILHQLGEMMGQETSKGNFSIFNNAGLETTRSSAEICQKIFEEVERETAKASALLRGRKQQVGEKVKLSKAEKAKWPFLQPGLEILRTDLREAKGTLMLMLQVASLALSKQVADLNTSTSSNIMEQKDVIRSILILQQQQQRLNPYPHSNNARRSTNRVRDQMNGIGGSSRDVNEDSSISSFIAEPLTAHAGSHSDTTPAREQLGQDARRPDEIKQNQTNSTTDAENTILDDAVSPPSGDPSRATSGTKSNDRASRRSSLEIQADTRIEELRTYSVYPDLTASFAKVQVTWSWSESRIPESNIRHRLAKNEADGLAPVFDVLEALHTYERPIVDRALDWVQGINPAYRVNLMGLKRTEQDMQHGSIVFKAVPCFNLIVKLDCHPSRQPTAESNHIVSMIVDPPWVKDLSRPTYIKVHRKHLSPDTLDEYDLPWEWDKRDSRYIIIKRWVPENDQNILFEHTRLLKERKQLANRDALVEKRLHPRRSGQRGEETSMSMRHERAESIDLPRTPMAFAPNYRSEKDTDRVLAEGIDKRRVEDTKVELKKEKDQLLLVRKKRQSFPSSHSTSEDTSEDTETRSLASLDFTASKQTEGDDVFAESEDGDVPGRLSSDEPEETAAVNELLERYTTLFEKDATSQSPVQADNDALGGRTWIIT